MENLFWGVMAMVIKDALKQQYLKSRDYERNVRQVYRDVDNLHITLAHIRSNCTPADLTTGPHAAFIRRAQRQLRAAYRTLAVHYDSSTARILHYAATPGAEMHLLDIGKEANQTAKGLNDLLAEIRFAKIGKAKAADAAATAAATAAASKTLLEAPPPPSPGSVALSVRAASSSASAGSPRSMSSDASSLFDHSHVRPSSIHSPTSSITTANSSSSSSHRRRASANASNYRKKHAALPHPPSRHAPKPLDTILESGGSSAVARREHALDRLHDSIEYVLRTAPPQDDEEEDVAMEELERALAEVMRLQRRTKSSSRGGSEEDLGDAVEVLDEVMQCLLGARDKREKKYAMKRLGRALQDVEAALEERQRLKGEEAEAAKVVARRQHRMSAVPVQEKKKKKRPSSSSSSSRLPAHGSDERKMKHGRERSRRASSVY